MSLNGLDVTAVADAHQSTLADPAGWFLLHYANRDTVELLGRGNGGVAEAKGVVEKYELKSPLYGMLQYRRKRVLLKYVPEGTSRLLQVRLTVQFQSVLDAFPHDAVFSFVAPTELVESALGLCTMLLPTNPGSLKSSSSSLRQRRLNEISEDVEELNTPSHPGMQPPKQVLEESNVNTLPASALRAKALLAKRKEENQTVVPIPYVLPEPESVASEIQEPDLPPRPSINLSQFRDEIASVSSANTKARETPQRIHHSRHLSENESANISQWTEQVAAYVIPTPTPKPKKKLAPRPHVESAPRPKTAGQDEVSARPVANLPQSVKISARMNTNSYLRPSSQQSSRSVPTRWVPDTSFAPPMPNLQQFQPMYMRSDNHRAGSVTSSIAPEPPAPSPEKLRLMKALQHRKRSQLLNQRAASSQSNFRNADDSFPLGMASTSQASRSLPMSKAIPEEVTQVSIQSIHDSSTASPTSNTTMSEHTSTRPSSLADEPEGHSSRQSASHDTDSSSTPKALNETSLDSQRKQEVWNKTMPTSDEESVSAIPHQTSVQSHEQSRKLWLASESRNEMIQSTAQSANAHQPMHLLSMDTAVQPSTENSSVISDYDDLDEELQSATVHEAKHVSVSRTPQTPTMRNVSIDRTRAMTTSTFSISPPSHRTTPAINDKSPVLSQRSDSTALPPCPPSADEPTMIPLTKKGTIGHGISRRIKALEDSSRPQSIVNSGPSAVDPSVTRSSVSNLMKRSSFISQFQASSAQSEKSTGKSKPAHIATAAANLFSFPGTERKNSVNEPSQGIAELDGSGSREPRQMGRLSRVPDMPAFLFEPLASPTEKKRFSFASYRSNSTAKVPQSDAMTSKVSLQVKDNRGLKSAGSESSSKQEDKQGSRTSRLMKRVSGLGSRFTKQIPVASSKSIKEEPRSPTVMEYEPSGRSNSIADSSMQLIDVGNVNVQFPESLLWKRRFLRIDDQGYLIFSAPVENSTARTMSRKFHLADVQEPCLPDMEREEMAWSVLLDLRDGNCIQCACDSKHAQTQVLKMLLDAHSAYHSLYSDAP